jgi:integrase
MWAGSSAWHERLTCTHSSEETAFSLMGNGRLSTYLEEFKDFLLVDLRRSKKTAVEQVRCVRRFLESLNGDSVSREDMRQYLKQISGEATYRNTLASLKRFFRDFLEMPQIVQSFRFPPSQFKPKVIPSKEDLREFFEAIDSDIGKALFLFYATTGLRKNEVLTLRRDNIDFGKRMVTPKCHSGSTKHSYLSFYNGETEALLKKLGGDNEKLFPISDRQYKKVWKVAKDKTGIRIRPQMLRDWFCEEMGRLGVSDRYIDAFCGRTPKSVLARHYSDYSPDKLKAIYDKANLRVLA